MSCEVSRKSHGFKDETNFSGGKNCLNIPTNIKWWTWAANKLQGRLTADRAKQQWKWTVSWKKEFIVQELRFHKDPDFFFKGCSSCSLQMYLGRGKNKKIKKNLSRRHIPLWHDHIFYSNNPISIKGTRERERGEQETDTISFKGKSQSHTSITQRNMQGLLLIIILNVDRGFFYTDNIACIWELVENASILGEQKKR